LTLLVETCLELKIPFSWHETYITGQSIRDVSKNLVILFFVTPGPCIRGHNLTSKRPELINHG